MRRIRDEVDYGLLILIGGICTWGLAALIIALYATSVALAMLGLALINVVAISLAWRDRAIPAGHDTEWADHARPPARPPAALPPTRRLRVGEPARGRAGGGAVTTARQTYIYDN